ncbi:MAG: hypothetical protein IKG01_14655 [Lachnospiraceae bacterium]|nr:hypothetical protein [Lachnospiraceae bacterium]
MSGFRPGCNDLRPCFARDDRRRCKILKENPFNDESDRLCPFCKREEEVTKGKRYPFNKDYGQVEP